MFKIFYYITFVIFLLVAIIFWVYTDEFFNWLYGYNYGIPVSAPDAERLAVAKTAEVRQLFSWGAVLISIICFVISILAIRRRITERVLAYVSLLMSGITIMIFIISFFGHGILPTRGIL